MADRKPRPRDAGESEEAIDESERALGRAVARWLPVVTVVSAIAIGVASGLGAALLVLAAGVLLGTIAFLWASLRTLSGDAALPLELEMMAARGRRSTDLGEKKIRALRALKDIENEHALGKIDDDDYRDLVARYRDEAKAVLREIDREAAPRRAEAERLVREYLTKKRIPGASSGAEATPATRRECDACHGSNEADATFCKHCGARMKREADVRDATS
jgi:hypothetical protein